MYLGGEAVAVPCLLVEQLHLLLLHAQLAGVHHLAQRAQALGLVHPAVHLYMYVRVCMYASMPWPRPPRRLPGHTRCRHIHKCISVHI